MTIPPGALCDSFGRTSGLQLPTVAVDSNGFGRYVPWTACCFNWLRSKWWCVFAGIDVAEKTEGVDQAETRIPSME